MRLQLSRLLAFIGLAGLFLVIAAPSYNPGEYSGVTPQAAATSVSGVIATKPVLVSKCWITNTKASAQYYFLFDSTTVPSVTTSHVIGVVSCPATSVCTWDAPFAVTPRGGQGIATSKGFAWSNSSTFPTLTGGSADSFIQCALSFYQ